MEIDELERGLSELSTSEIAYKDGMAFDWSIMTEHVEIDGCPVRKIGQPGFAYAQPGMPRGLTIRKNSRFNAVPEHVHDYVELSYVYRGRCPQTVAGERLELGRNEVLLLDALCPHAVAALGEDDIMLSMTVSRSFLRRSLESSLSRESAVSRFLFNALNSETDHRGHVRFHCGESVGFGATCRRCSASCTTRAPTVPRSSCVCFSCFWPSSWIATSASWCAARRTARRGPLPW